MNLTIRSFSPGASTAVAVTRPASGSLSEETPSESGPANSWSMAAATRISLRWVMWTSSTIVPLARWRSDRSGDSSAAAARGSPCQAGSCSLATSSDWMTIRAGSPTGSIS